MITIEKFIYLLEYPFNILILGTLIFGGPYNETFYQYLPQKLYRLQTRLCEDPELTQQFYASLGRRILKLLISVFIFHATCVAFDVLCCDYNWLCTLHSNSIHNLPGLMISLNLIQYAIALHILWQLHVQLCDRLLVVKRLLNESFLPPTGYQKLLGAGYEKAFCAFVDGHKEMESRLTEAVQLLEMLRLTSATLDRLHSKLIGILGYVLLLNLCNSFFSFCVDFFAIYKFFEEPNWHSYALFLYRVLWLILHGGRIWLILKGNERIVEQKCELCLLLNELDICDKECERVINRFLLQLNADEGHVVAACGVIDLDTLVLGGFIGALLAIVIFLIQIELGNNSLMGIALNKSEWNYF
ncbi:putative gustatory receptor 59e [Scaptodrosophila lebanonensis]|uniref:Gustatory receptor n=1 Tax=Drosophila lebanonensis TaxID=7225 RepID=A0A6J2ULQ5_DROLE|nr:putative gustatory receptor 59e [Scaptodrosophila lebanonensis]